MILLCALLALQSGSPDAAYDVALRALEDGAYGVAWEAAAQVESPVERSRARTSILSQAGDLLGALENARQGLLEAPQHLELLFHATANALALRDGAQARTHLERLDAAVAAADMAPEHRPAWEGVVDGFRPRVEDLERVERERARALTAARTTSLLLLGLLVVGFLRFGVEWGDQD